MDKKQIIKSMQDFRGGREFICVAHLAEYREISERKAAKLVETLPYIREGRRRDYQITDVVERMLDQREL